MKIRVDYEIPDGVISDAILNGLECGIVRWCDEYEDVGGAILLTTVRGEEHALTREKIKEGIRVLATKYPYHFNDLIRRAGDSDTSDALIQCALFGKEVY
tara:strand:- start:729 stop:1028 length:300 start_codon:yes stop_codon:yes gene_type:complete